MELQEVVTPEDAGKLRALLETAETAGVQEVRVPWRVEGVAPELLELWTELPGSIEKKLRAISDAVWRERASFGVKSAGAPDGPFETGWASIEATYADHVMVSGAEDTMYRADWSMDENGEVTLSNITPVEVTVTVTPSAEAARTDSPELLEAFRAPVKVLAEADRQAGEAGPSDHLMTVECVLGQADVPTANGRIYPRSLFESIVQESTAGTDRSKGWLGESDHPSDGYSRVSATVSTPWRNFVLHEDGRLTAETDVIDTAAGADLQKLIRNGVQVQVSSRTFATTTKEVRGGRVVEIVNEMEALKNLRGWDFVLGAAAPGSGLLSYTEVATPAAGPSTDTGSQGDVDEGFTTMDAQELAEAMVKGNAPLVEKLTALMERAEPTPAPAPVVETAPAPTPAPVVETVSPEVVLLRGAILETEEVKTWPEKAKQFLSLRLESVTDVDGMAACVETAKAKLVEMGMLIVNGKPGTGVVAAHVAQSKEGSFAARAKQFQQEYALPEADRPATLKEMVALLSEGVVEDNGMRSTDQSGDPVRAELGNALPFPGYHPGNPRHQLEAVLWECVKFENSKYARPHLKPLHEWTAVADVAQTVPYILPMIPQVWMRLIARELCSVQPMNKSTGLVHYLNILADPSNANFANPGEWNSEYAQHISEQTAMRELSLTVTHADLTMDTKKLKAEWSTEVRQNLAADFGLAIAPTMLTAMVDEIAREVNALLLNDMLYTADPNGIITAGNVNYGTQLPAAGYTNLWEWYPEIYTAILQADMLVRAQRRARTNWIVAGPEALTRIQRCEKWAASPNDTAGYDWNVGINRVGTVSGPVTFNVYGADADVFPTARMLLGRRGTEWPDAGEVYCPWIPLFTAGPFVDPDTFCETEAAMSRFGYRKVVGNCFSTVTCLAQAGVPY